MHLCRVAFLVASCARLQVALGDGPLQEACSTEWTKSGDMCYKYIPTFTTWYEGATLCSETHPGATLATICNEQQNQAAAILITKSGDAWLGRRAGQGWMDGSSCDWHPAEGMTEACYRMFAIEHDLYPAWGSMDCDSRSRHLYSTSAGYPMCGYSLTTTATTTTPLCPTQWTQSGNMCYHYVPTFTTWNEAVDLCASLYPGATLATICNEQQNQAAAILITKSGDAWLGRRAGQGWMDGSSCDWHPAESITEACYRMFTIEHDLYPAWGSMDCDSLSRHLYSTSAGYPMCGFCLQDCDAQSSVSCTSQWPRPILIVLLGALLSFVT